MNKWSILILTSCLFFACDKKEAADNSLVGTWQLTEQLLDPGDGSGTFMPVNSQKTITFFSNGSLESNGPMCNMSLSSNQLSTGTYSTTDSTITIDNCNSGPWPISYMVANTNLYLYYPCIEGCGQKYVKL